MTCPHSRVSADSSLTKVDVVPVPPALWTLPPAPLPRDDAELVAPLPKLDVEATVGKEGVAPSSHGHVVGCW
jgi:hypothetical protein